MNRRGFISMLAGAAGAPLVPWRGIIEPLILLPPRPNVWTFPDVDSKYWMQVDYLRERILRAESLAVAQHLDNQFYRLTMQNGIVIDGTVNRYEGWNEAIG